MYYVGHALDTCPIQCHRKYCRNTSSNWRTRATIGNTGTISARLHATSPRPSAVASRPIVDVDDTFALTWPSSRSPATPMSCSIASRSAGEAGADVGGAFPALERSGLSSSTMVGRCGSWPALAAACLAARCSTVGARLLWLEIAGRASIASTGNAGARSCSVCRRGTGRGPALSMAFSCGNDAGFNLSSDRRQPRTCSINACAGLPLGLCC